MNKLMKKVKELEDICKTLEDLNGGDGRIPSPADIAVAHLREVVDSLKAEISKDKTSAFSYYAGEMAKLKPGPYGLHFKVVDGDGANTNYMAVNKASMAAMLQLYFTMEPPA